jgi:hypothetical protein
MILGTNVMNTEQEVRVVALVIGTVNVEWFPTTPENYRS